MAQIIRSGAFLQQCWSVHPLCVTVKRMAKDRTLVLICSACKSAHYLSLGVVVQKDSAAQGATGATLANVEDHGQALLSACITSHQASITLREMDVFQDLVLLRCGDCRRHYELMVSSFETHQK